MREVVLKMSMSLDGFVSDTTGQNAWMFGADMVAKQWSVETVSGAGLHVMGHRSFRDMAGFWPTADNPFAAAMNSIPKAVFAREGLAAGGDTLAGNWAEAHVARGDLATEIAALKAQPGRPIFAHGGVRFARSLVAAGLVDRFVLLVLPVALGNGLALFSDLTAPLSLRLEESIAFPGGAVAQIYRPA